MDYIIELIMIIVGVFILSLMILILIGMMESLESPSAIQSIAVLIGFFISLVCIGGIIYFIACLWGVSIDLIGNYPNIEGPQDSLIIFIKLLSIGYGFCLFFMLITVFPMFAEKMKEYSSMKFLANISFYGVIASGLAF